MVFGIFEKFDVDKYGRKKVRKGTKTLVVLGVEGSGKSTLIYQLKSGKYVQTLPTLDSGVVNIRIHGSNIDFIDIGGTQRLQKLWPNYVKVVDAVIFVVDSSSETGLTRAQEALSNLIQQNPNVRMIPLLVLANKQDKSNAALAVKVEKYLDLGHFSMDSTLCVACSAKTGSGINAAMMWLCSKL